ncbi:MAG TPA: hypothetical protein VJN67_03415, partial [Stellaceae bacterium]|nr:hypothetical protein [Stellaceae bacterium]
PDERIEAGAERHDTDEESERELSHARPRTTRDMKGLLTMPSITHESGGALDEERRRRCRPRGETKPAGGWT